MTKASDHHVRFSLESVTSCNVPKAMFTAHYEELAPLKAALKLDPDWDQYRKWQAAGELVLVIARNQDNEVVGYAAMVIRPHPHYRGVKIAVDDLHYLAPAYRSLGVGKEMIKFAEAAAFNMGARVMTMRCKAGHNHGHIFESMGYSLCDLVYLKDLTHEVA